MSQSPAEVTWTQHALLVAWGHFGQQIGLVQALEVVQLKQKTCTHSPQTKVLEFLVAMLAGVPHMKDISHSAHPLDQDALVAQAWGQAGWADASGVSRTLQALTEAEAHQVVRALQQVSQPYIDREVARAMGEQGRVVYDGDLTGRAVSNTSTSYPNVAYGHMSDEIRLGYQAALVSLHSPTYGRVWLSVQPHPGNTIACSQAEALVRAAEARTGVRPRRRADRLRQRLEAVTGECQQAEEHLAHVRQALAQAEAKQDELAQTVQHWQAEVERLDTEYAARRRRERPHSRLAQARARLALYRRRSERQPGRVAQARQHVERQQTQVTVWQATLRRLKQRLSHFEQDDAANPNPVSAVFRLDAGFGTGENVALRIELGYEVYTKPYNHQVTTRLRRRVSDRANWTRVGANAELLAWPSQTISGCPYPLDLALERFYTGKTIRYSTLVHYGQDPVASNLPQWFHMYNGRQIIEAGVKEGKGVFQMHHLKVRSASALLVQEHLAAFAANFVRWAAHWLSSQCLSASDSIPTGVKEMVQVGTHTSAYVERLADGWCIYFSQFSAYAGRVLRTGTCALQLPLPLFQTFDFSSV